ncbi:MAG TPA: shikimate kinase [Allosphingosinicella sp.]|nr:shikimate kinase [Allosphingosinicella sp.]
MPDGGFQLDRTIALVGPMGSGKSSIGRMLAARLDLPFADSDNEVVRSAGMTIAEMFDRFGEPVFRKRERQAIRHLLALPPRVIATGGGAFVDEPTRRRLLDRCFTVWLDAPVEVLLGRLPDDDQRPLLRGPDPASALELLCAERRPFYALAHLRVQSGDFPHEQVVDRIIKAMAGLRK